MNGLRSIAAAVLLFTLTAVPVICAADNASNPLAAVNNIDLRALGVTVRC